MAGSRTKDDGGGGDYIWSDTSTLEDDGGAVIRPNSISKNMPGRYIYDVKDGVVNLKWWGKRSGDDITVEIAAAEAFMKYSKIGVFIFLLILHCHVITIIEVHGLLIIQ